ncbi:unnamed protein product [Nyctereutes procyonoides]|uniref:(raccoon dog) hypothetical protein n=1 Tax=Nyctereutes procyonoides TaxID=34880 RepID=A0A811Y2P6_NYCPR|nr:unnamed protein product [Nyctereutes procyonoides]
MSSFSPPARTAEWLVPRCVWVAGGAVPRHPDHLTEVVIAPGVRTYFLKTRRKTGYWLVTILHDRQINSNDLANQLGVEREIFSGCEKVYFPPMTNTTTTELNPDEFLTFVRKTKHHLTILNFDKNN